jgi:hypothetical protein
MDSTIAMRMAVKDARKKIVLSYANPECPEAREAYALEVLRHYLNITDRNGPALLGIAMEKFK